MGLAHLDLVSVFWFSNILIGGHGSRFLLSVLSLFEEDAQIAKQMSMVST